MEQPRRQGSKRQRSKRKRRHRRKSHNQEQGSPSAKVIDVGDAPPKLGAMPIQPSRRSLRRASDNHSSSGNTLDKAKKLKPPKPHKRRSRYSEDSLNKQSDKSYVGPPPAVGQEKKPTMVFDASNGFRGLSIQSDNSEKMMAFRPASGSRDTISSEAFRLLDQPSKRDLRKKAVQKYLNRPEAKQMVEINTPLPNAEEAGRKSVAPGYAKWKHQQDLKRAKQGCFGFLSRIFPSRSKKLKNSNPVKVE
eukprot:maker-scaffold_5-snap-gene-8.14-mRNA-1 protein AED:0.00 eAED:0.00 QI:102/1/1/1/1/1/2/702/247